MKIAVIGGGLTGCLVALELAERGHPVAIFDREDALIQRASLANEGKIHLGYVYSADPTMRTAQTLIDDALLFRPLIERWMGAAEFDACLTEPFSYVVPHGSQVSPERILEHFRQVDICLKERQDELNLCYLGQAQLSSFAVAGRCPTTQGLWVETPERAVWPAGIAAVLRTCVASHPRIEVVAGAAVCHARAGRGKWQLVLADPGRAPEGPFDIVVNAAWAERRNIDRGSGFPSSDAWFTRFKFGVLLENAAEAFGGAVPRNATGTLGPYGDSVYYEKDDCLYCSWYPVGMCYTSCEDDTDFLLPAAAEANRLMRETWEGYATLDPAYGVLGALAGRLEARLVGDFIVAAGQTDIVDPASGLHERWVQGPRELGRGYWSVDTGKYTSAPRCAATCADAIAGAA
ncbi:FAD-dependent oxidoreductase [Aestuariibius sp. 2305UL40-4]|uniref:FAD-dependent oxidoreductase n=1 Tax=Aestuariibius violaceus TaxID=3234132 RepID=UPI00345E27BB